MRNGHTLGELIVTAAIIGTLATTAMPRLGRLRDQAAVHAAASTLRAALAMARDAAMTRATPILATIDPTRSSVVVVELGGDTLLDQPLDAERQTQLSASRDTVRYGPSGRAIGASNTTLILRRRAAAETVTVSRLGRVRLGSGR